MGNAPAKEWKCDQCSVVTIQTGPRAADVLPNPPYDWILVDVVETLPPRSVEVGGSKVKLSASRETLRRSFCPACKGPYLPVPAPVPVTP
jgi:hypothetical protein